MVVWVHSHEPTKILCARKHDLYFVWYFCACRIQPIKGRLTVMQSWKQYLMGETRWGCWKLQGCCPLISSRLIDQPDFGCTALLWLWCAPYVPFSLDTYAKMLVSENGHDEYGLLKISVQNSWGEDWPSFLLFPTVYNIFCRWKNWAMRP